MAEEKKVTAQTKESEPMIPLSDVKKLIAEAVANIKEENKPKKVERVKDHLAHAYRFNGKWVVDFIDQNNDPYVKHKVHAFNKFNETSRQFEPYIEIKYQDGKTETLPLFRYVEKRLPVYCKILKRDKIDKSYSIGEVQKTDWVNDKRVGTGVMIDQMVEMYEEVFTLQTPEGETLVLADYVIA